MVSTRYLLVCAVLSLTTLAKAQIVECVDANGKKSYAQACPVGAEKRRDIETPVPAPAPKPNAANDAAKKKLEDQEKAFAQRRQERVKAEAKDADEQKKRAEAAQLCEDAQHRLAVLESGRQFKRADPETGEHVPMDQDQRQAEIDKLHAQIRLACQ